LKNDFGLEKSKKKINRKIKLNYSCMFIYLTNVQNDVDKINAARIHYPIRVTWFTTTNL